MSQFALHNTHYILVNVHTCTIRIFVNVISRFNDGVIRTFITTYTKHTFFI